MPKDSNFMAGSFCTSDQGPTEIWPINDLQPTSTLLVTPENGVASPETGHSYQSPGLIRDPRAVVTIGYKMERKLKN